MKIAVASGKGGTENTNNRQDWAKSS